MVGANRWWQRCWALAASTLALSLVACDQPQMAAVPTMTQSAATPTTTQSDATPAGMQSSPASTEVPATATPGVPLNDLDFADPAFRALWERSDHDMATGTATRSWLWGQPVPSGTRREPYAEAGGGERLVEYYDKGRMEINDTNADPTGLWYVTSGLLTIELVTGQVQVGGDLFENHEPAEIPVAGDLESVDPQTPLYADYTAERLARVPDRTGQPVTTLLQPGKSDVQIRPPVKVKIAEYDDVLGHNIPDVFVDYFTHDFNDRGLNPLFVMGHPISEPYWINARFGGKTQLVLVQLFERRALTYNPDNDDGWEVEFANIGLHYFRWRYHDR